MPSRRKKIWIIIATLFAAWIIGAQSCMKFRISDSEAIAAFRKSGLEVELQDFNYKKEKIHYAICGDAKLPVIFFVHGSPGSWNAFMEYMKDTSLLKHYQLVSIDRPGFGYSHYGRGEKMGVQADAIAALIALLKKDRPFYLVGHSLGGPMIVKLAAHYPQYVDGIVLLAASVDPGEEKPERWRPVMKLPPFRWLMPGAFKPSNDELWYFKKDVLTMPADLEAVKCPVVICQGLKDDMVPPGNAYYAREHMKNAPAVLMNILPEANHFIPWTRYNIIRHALFQVDSLHREVVKS